MTNFSYNKEVRKKLAKELIIDGIPLKKAYLIAGLNPEIVAELDREISEGEEKAD